MKNFIKVNPNSGNNIFNGSSSSCIDVKVPNNDKTIGIPNSDLHLYITYQNDPSSGFLANAGACILQ